LGAASRAARTSAVNFAELSAALRIESMGPAATSRVVPARFNSTARFVVAERKDIVVWTLTRRPTVAVEIEIV
jgi:hypothetical protein